MQRPDYTALDQDILKSIQKGNTRFRAIADGIPANNPLRVYDRTIDARLQALRRKNKISYTSKGGWTAVKESAK